MNKTKNDIFADIAAGGVNFKGKNLIEPKPPTLEKKYFNTEYIDEKAFFEPVKKLSTEKELEEELGKYKSIYTPFMENYAPKPESYRIKKELEEFDWRIQTKEDEADFLGVISGNGSWEKVKIPHYGEPLGVASTYYRTEFEISRQMINTGRVFICFKGIDYVAHVFINGCFIGSHEGFFAPFEFDFTECAKVGQNTIVIKVENDFICGGNSSPDTGSMLLTGDKIYAATGVGYDDAKRGWHHCPPGMGIYQDVFVEMQPALNISDVFVRPMEDLKNAEAWIEVMNCDIYPKNSKFRISVYGRNFRETVFEGMEYEPATGIAVGMGDSFSEANLKASGKLNATIPLQMEKGRNRIIVPFNIPDAKVWELKSPWLYQINVELIVNGNVVDTFSRHFGMRFFKMDTVNIPKGAMHLNGRQIRLRGANTMGHEQQCVMKKEFRQLIEDILLAKICNMNFWRLTQRPVQPEVYDYCDMLGLMTQSDLPLFGVLSRNQFCEAVRQAEEMERLVRHHPCNIMVTYINEPFPNAKNKPHRNLTRPELMEFFKAADILVKLNNPDRVIKHVDGDYDPPSESLPDNHCYPGWYNGHGLDIGRLNKGYWLPVKPGWYYGCGEFGSEGLDPVSVMRKYYPKSWLPQNPEEEKNWSPNQIIGAQTGNFHYFFYETPDTLEGWVKESHKHQAFVTRIMTEAFRRDAKMATFAIHLFIDAFPSGWMKTIMDVERRPKPAYFEYRNSLEPLIVSLRSDRFKYFAGEDVLVEAWVCNDSVEVPENACLKIMVKTGDKVLCASSQKANIPSCSSGFQGFTKFAAPNVTQREGVSILAAICDANGEVLNDTQMQVEVLPREKEEEKINAAVIGEKDAAVLKLLTDVNANVIKLHNGITPDVAIVEDFEAYKSHEEAIIKSVEDGMTLIFINLKPGEYEITGQTVKVKSCSMLPLHFVSRNTGHPVVEGFKPDDFKHWYSEKEGYITPLLKNTFTVEGFNPILTSANTNDKGEWVLALAAAEKRVGKGRIMICQVDILGRCRTNPIADRFVKRMISYN